MNVRKAIEAANRLAQRANAIREREKRADSLIETRHHLNGIQARGGWNLHEHQNDAKAFTYVLEQNRERVNDAQVCKRSHGGRKIHCADILRMNSQKNQTRAANGRLQYREEREHNKAAHVALRHREILYAFGVYFLPHDDQQHERANPKRQVNEQRRHGKAVDVHFIELFGHNRCRRAHEIRNSIGIKRAIFHKRRNGIRTRQAQKAHFQRSQITRERLKQTIGLAQCIMRGIKRAIKGIQNGFRLVNKQLLAGSRCLKLRRCRVHIAQTLRYRRNHGAKKRFRTLLQRRDCSL